MRSIPDLVQIHQKYGPQGLAIIAITSDSKSSLADFIKQHGITYPVAHDTRREVFRLYGVRGIPHCLLLDVRGKVVWEGHSASIPREKIEQLLKEVQLYKLREVVDSLKPAKKYFESMKFGKAWQAAQKVLTNENATEEEKKDANYICQEVEKAARSKFESIDYYVNERYYLRAIKELKWVKKHFAGTKFSPQAQQRLRKLMQDKQVKREMRAARILEQLKYRETKARKRKEKLALAKSYRLFAQQYEGTRAAEEAAQRAQKLEQEAERMRR